MATDQIDTEVDDVTFLRRRDGSVTHALVPVDRWNRIEAIMDALGNPQTPEDAMDLALIEARRSTGAPERGISLAVARRIRAGDHPIKVFREDRKMSQAELAEQVGSTAQYISQLETGARFAGLPLLGSLANALEVDVEDLITPSMLAQAPIWNRKTQTVRFFFVLAKNSVQMVSITQEALEQLVKSPFSDPAKEALEAFASLRQHILDLARKLLAAGRPTTDGILLIEGQDLID